jgi:diguanylate cyclase
MHIYFDGIEISTPLLLAIMATVGYVFGTLRQREGIGNDKVLLRLKKDLSRAKVAVSELERVVCAVRGSMSTHYSRLKKFQSRIARLNSLQGDEVWQGLCQEVEGILDPTLQLVSDIANAQERIRYQSNYLMTFTEVRTDPLTGLGNRRAMDHVLGMQFGILKCDGTPFSLAVVDIDRFKVLNDEHGHQHGDQMLCRLKELLLSAVRAVDIIARYGGDELVIVMPHTNITGAASLGERLRSEVERAMPFTISVGIASADDGDTPESLFNRADAALYRAKGGGRNRIECDHGDTVDVVLQEAEAGCS